ncbi:hypothetical protein [Streptomyces sp. H27-D2]|uniref:hypothetical protein n=1 Tax=Streptomyces sp. H27-D2 TaxID=3046304 RepID=UPI002DBB96FC|nr:hypothetical protein [Streptomyces sp. H27-D2]MEC4016062.1 hypothetical protein [Streptomyces sp. H27-D2]
MTDPCVRQWQDIAPADAVDTDLEFDMTITAPLNEGGERCPWPWEPQQLVGAPLGQYHCGYCGAMVIAGVPHIDYRELGRASA